MRPLKALRAERERLARLEKTTKIIRGNVAPVEDLLSSLKDSLDRHDAMLIKLDERTKVVERLIGGTTHQLQVMEERVTAIARAVGDVGSFVERQTKVHGARMKALQNEIGSRLSRLRGPFDAPHEGVFIDMARPVVETRRTLLGYDRLYVLWQAARNSVHLDLPAVEIGTYRGGSACLIAQALRRFAGEEREFHAVDTFEGHPDSRFSAHDPERQRGKFRDTSYDDVRDYLAPFPRAQVHKGEAGELLRRWPDKRFSLVHLDVDLYEPTRECLEYFGPRLPQGGIIVVDDFGAPSCPGVAKAVREFLNHEPRYHQWNAAVEQLVLVGRD